jgi:uncharacterized protein YndB with AHSA1/START domain
VIINGTVVHEQVYPYPIERVWHALVDRAELATWLMANDAVAEVGARFRFDGGAELGPVEVEVIEVVPPTRLVWQWTFRARRSRVTLDLVQDDGATTLRLEHRMLSAEDAAGFDAGWSAKLGGDLVDLLSGVHRAADCGVSGGLTCHPRFRDQSGDTDCGATGTAAELSGGSL